MIIPFSLPLIQPLVSWRLRAFIVSAETSQYKCSRECARQQRSDSLAKEIYSRWHPRQIAG
mgnify:CR=1 FL=1